MNIPQISHNSHLSSGSSRPSRSAYLRPLAQLLPMPQRDRTPPSRDSHILSPTQRAQCKRLAKRMHNVGLVLMIVSSLALFNELTTWIAHWHSLSDLEMLHRLQRFLNQGTPLPWRYFYKDLVEPGMGLLVGGLLRRGSRGLRPPVTAEGQDGIPLFSLVDTCNSLCTLLYAQAIVLVGIIWLAVFWGA